MTLTEKLAVDDLEVGMYVAQLDRPWLETPFLFQGFFIRDNAEIEELRAHCQHVYVSKESLEECASPRKTRASRPGPVNGAPKQEKKKALSLKNLMRRFRRSADETEIEQTNVFYTEKASLAHEMPVASQVHDQSASAFRDVMQSLESSGKLDFDQLGSTIEPMVESVLRNPAALACLMRMRKTDDYLYHHSLACSVWASILGRQLGLEKADIEILATGAILLDVGKTHIPQSILNKPGPLEEADRQLVRRHVQFGLDILEKSGRVDHRVLDMVAHHHERHNGTGYPAGLSGNQIPVFGRIAGIVDAYDAMISSRPYARLHSSYDAIRRLQQLSDVEFQAEIVDQFTQAIGAFPTGTLVELNTGEIAVVTRQNRIRRLRPEVMLILAPDKTVLDDFRVVDLNDETVAPSGEVSLWIERGLPPGSHGIDPSEYYLD